MRKSEVLGILGLADVPTTRVGDEVQRVGAPEVSRKHPSQRKVGREGMDFKPIRHSGRENRGFELGFKTKYTESEVQEASRKETGRMHREEDFHDMDFSEQVGGISESNLLKENMGDTTTRKRSIPHERVAVQGEKGLKSYKQLTPGVHVPVGHLPPSLTIQPKSIRDDFLSFMRVQEADQEPKKLSVPKKAMRTETYVEEETSSEEEKMRVPKMKAVPMTMSKMRSKTMDESELGVHGRKSAPLPVKEKKAPSAYNAFVSKKRKEGFTMTEIGQMWRQR